MTADKRMPWGMFYWADYAADPQLKLCSLAAQGLWMRMLCVAAEHEGYVAVNEKPLGAPELARMCGEPIELIEKLLEELGGNGVYSRNRSGVIYSRRMINDRKRRDNARKNGKLGGNPTLRKQKGNSGQDNQEDKSEDKTRLKPQSPESRDYREKTTDESVVQKPKILLPEGWEPEPFGDDTASREIVDGWTLKELQAQLEAFRAHHVAAESKFKNWQAAWSTWVLNSVRFSARGQSKPGGSSGDDKFLDILAAEYAPQLLTKGK